MQDSRGSLQSSYARCSVIFKNDIYRFLSGLKQRATTTPIPPNSTTKNLTTSLPICLDETEVEPLIKPKSTRRSNKSTREFKSTHRSSNRSVYDDQGIVLTFNFLKLHYGRYE